MERFLNRHQGPHSGSITGFDRLLFRGILRSIGYVADSNSSRRTRRVPFKGFKAFVEEFSAGVRKRAEETAKPAGWPLIYLSARRTDKEKRVREILERDRMEGGVSRCPGLRRTVPVIRGGAPTGRSANCRCGPRAEEPASLLLPAESGLGVDAAATADLVAVDDARVRERAGMAGAADEARRDQGDQQDDGFTSIRCGGKP